MKLPLRFQLAALFALTFPLIGWSQQSSTQPNQQRHQQDAQSRGQGDDYNQELINFLAAKLMLANQCQVELAGMATEKAEHEKVKQFAEALKKDHQKLNKKLKDTFPRLEKVEPLSFAKKSSDEKRSHATNKSSQAARDSKTGNRQADKQARQQTAFLDGGAQTLIDICRRATENSHQRTSEMLSQKQGKKFDMCFVASQVGVHTWMISELEAIRDLGPKQFSRIIQDAEGIAGNHLEKAQKLAETLEAQRTSQQADKSQETSNRVSKN